MSRMLSKMNLISVVQQLPNDDIETIQGYVEMIENENQQLQERIEYLERSNNRREDIILEQRQEISDLEDNWNKLREYIVKEYYMYLPLEASTKPITILTDKMHGLEQGEE